MPFQALAQRAVQTIRQKAHQNVRLDPRLDVMPDRAQMQVALEGLEDAFDPLEEVPRVVLSLVWPGRIS